MFDDYVKRARELGSEFRELFRKDKVITKYKSKLKFFYLNNLISDATNKVKQFELFVTHS